MADVHPLAIIFLEHARGPERGAVPFDAIERAIEDHFRAGVLAWPGVELAKDEFARHVGQRFEGEDLLADLQALRGAEMYLARACVGAAPAALHAFEAAFLAQVPVFLARMAPTPELIDETKQALREKLFIAKDGEPPKIASYSGRGSLATWLRVAAVRAALNLRRGDDPSGPGDDAIESLSEGGDAELDFMKSRYRAEFSEAIKDAFAALTSKQRNILRLHFVRGLTGEKIGEIFGVHQTTVARWLMAAREDVFSKTKELLSARLRLRREELDSLIVVLQSQLDISVTALLRETGA